MDTQATTTPTPQATAAAKDIFPTTQCDPRTGQWVREQHLKATGGCTDIHRTGDARLVL